MDQSLLLQVKKEKDSADMDISMSMSVKCEKVIQMEEMDSKKLTGKFPTCMTAVSDRAWVGFKDGSIVIFDIRSSVRFISSQSKHYD